MPLEQEEQPNIESSNKVDDDVVKPSLNKSIDSYIENINNEINTLIGKSLVWTYTIS